jgi:hypothetical protein
MRCNSGCAMGREKTCWQMPGCAGVRHASTYLVKDLVGAGEVDGLLEHIADLVQLLRLPPVVEGAGDEDLSGFRMLPAQRVSRGERARVQSSRTASPFERVARHRGRGCSEDTRQRCEQRMEVGRSSDGGGGDVGGGSGPTGVPPMERVWGGGLRLRRLMLRTLVGHGSKVVVAELCGGEESGVLGMLSTLVGGVERRCEVKLKSEAGSSKVCGCGNGETAGVPRPAALAPRCAIGWRPGNDDGRWTTDAGRRTMASAVAATSFLLGASSCRQGLAPRVVATMLLPAHQPANCHCHCHSKLQTAASLHPETVDLAPPGTTGTTGQAPQHQLP